MPYDAQGEGANRLPHLLIPEINTRWHSGIKWTVTCPYAETGGSPGCSIVEECNGTPEDVKKWGCLLFPTAPSDIENFDSLSQEERQAHWDEFEAKREIWDEAHDYRRHHPTSECWFANVAIPNSDFEPEYFLADIPDGTAVTGPLKVLVGYEGSDEDTEPKFRLWEEPTDADR